MSCSYQYKGRIFNSEAELNDFLVEEYPYMKDDTVFSLTPEQMQVREKMEKKLIQRGKETKEKLDDFRQNNPASRAQHLDEQGHDSLTAIDRPAIGVTRYLAKVKINDRQIEAEYRDKEFWENTYKKWDNGVVSDSMLEIINNYEGSTVTKEDIKAAAKDLRDKWRSAIMTQWEYQGNFGTAIHKISELYYNTKIGDKPLYKALED